MLIKYLSDHNVIDTPTCGAVREILKKADYAPLGVAICVDIGQTKGHFHNTFDEPRPKGRGLSKSPEF